MLPAFARSISARQVIGLSFQAHARSGQSRTITAVKGSGIVAVSSWRRMRSSVASPDSVRAIGGPVGKPLKAFFREMDAGNDVRLDLDFSCCKGWIDRGGDVWADTGVDIRHVGGFRLRRSVAAFLAALQASARQGRRPRRADERGLPSCMCCSKLPRREAPCEPWRGGSNKHVTFGT